MRRRDRPRLDNLGKTSPLLVVQDLCAPGCFARCQPIRAICVEAQDPVAHGLQCDPGKLRRVAPAATVQDQRYGQQSSNLVRIAASSRKPP
jgi:hypothetical protein